MKLDFLFNTLRFHVFKKNILYFENSVDQISWLLLKPANQDPHSFSSMPKIHIYNYLLALNVYIFNIGLPINISFKINIYSYAGNKG